MREIRRAGRRFGYRGMLVAFGIATTEGVISSRDRRGKTHLPAGRYRFFVDATTPDEPSGHWRIVIR